MAKTRLGEWLVQAGALTPEQVETVLSYQRLWRCKFGQSAADILGLSP